MKGIKEHLLESLNEAVVRPWRIDNEEKLDFADLHNGDSLVAFIEIQVSNEQIEYHSLAWANKLRNDEDDKIADFGQDLMDLKHGEALSPAKGRVYIRL